MKKTMTKKTPVKKAGSKKMMEKPVPMMKRGGMKKGAC